MNTSGQVSAIPLEEISSSLELTSPRILSERKLLVEPYLSPLNHISMRPLSLEYTPSSRIRVPPRVIRAPASCLSPLQQLAGCAVMEARLNTSINPHQMAGPSGPWNKKRSSTSNFWKAKGTAKEAKKSAVRGLKAVSGSNSRAKTNNIQVEESIARGVKRKSISNSPKDTAGPKTKKPKTSSSAKVEGGVISSHSTGKGGRTSARAKHSANSEKHMASSKATGDSSIKPQNSLSSSPSEDKEGNASRVVEGKIGANSSGDGAIPDSDTLESKTRTGRIYSFSGPSKGEDLVTDVNTEAGLAPKIEIATKSTTVDPADDTIAGRLATRKRKNKM
ncbi:hypothetical protein BDQ17DRAFT_1356272 [Cyathus striatus]|nr:hypothetical protein BDQ17DRAFT_1356272 [Cyathus striatus]